MGAHWTTTREILWQKGFFFFFQPEGETHNSLRSSFLSCDRVEYY